MFNYLIKSGGLTLAWVSMENDGCDAHTEIRKIIVETAT